MSASLLPNSRAPLCPAFCPFLLGALLATQLLGHYLMKPLQFLLLGLLVPLVGCGRAGAPASAPGAPAAPATAQSAGKAPTAASLIEARKGFKTNAKPPTGPKEPVPQPPPEVFSIVRFDSPVGPLPAYLSPDPKDGQKHPAIVWITGGDSNTIGDVWSAAPPDNDQTAAAFRQAGIVMMFPSLRGGNDNPGVREGFFGEVDDVLAAADFLAKQAYIDPARIYLGGHSTGGTLVLLVSECSDRFRAVFSFGPAADVAGYGPEYLPFDTSNPREIELRSPRHWLTSVRTPTFVIEGALEGNVESLQALASASTNPQLHFLLAQGASHFSVLAPVCRLLAEKVVHDTGAPGSLTLTDGEVNSAVANFR